MLAQFCRHQRKLARTRLVVGEGMGFRQFDQQGFPQRRRPVAGRFKQSLTRFDGFRAPHVLQIEQQDVGRRRK
jgi:hypothetical protein